MDGGCAPGHPTPSSSHPLLGSSLIPIRNHSLTHSPSHPPPHHYSRKITGDVNVPAGEVSFRARVDRENTFRGDDGKYPFEYGVVARYPGQGRVAREGFKDPKWVEGELLKFSTFSGGKFGAAEWGFVFEVGEGRRFLLLFERLRL